MVMYITQFSYYKNWRWHVFAIPGEDVLTTLVSLGKEILLAKLYWLPIAQRIDYKISSLCFDVVSDTAPLLLSDLLRLYVPSSSLHSSADTRICRILTRKKKFQGQRAFFHLGPVSWNKLLYSVRHALTQIRVQISTKNHTIPPSLRTRLLELLCIFSSSPYVSPCKTACDLHLCVCVCVCVR